MPTVRSRMFGIATAQDELMDMTDIDLAERLRVLRKKADIRQRIAMPQRLHMIR